MTSKHSTPKKVNSKSSQQVFPVRTCQSQDNKQGLERAQEVGYSLKSSDSLGKYDLNSSSLKMLEIYSLTKKGKLSSKSSKKLPKQGLMLSGRLFRQQIWQTPATKENESGLLPTPLASSKVEQRVPFKQGGKPLLAALLPTPRASAAMTEKLETIKERGKNNCRLEETIAETLPTPTAMDHLPQRGFESMVKQTTQHRKGRKKLANLREAVNPDTVKLFNELQKLNLPTPTARDYKDSGENMNYQKAAEKKRLAGVLNHTHSTLTGEGMYLNPHFVEEMMGYPIGYCV